MTRGPVTELYAFTAAHVCRLTGLSDGQLRYWDRTGFFSPTLLDDHNRRAFGRIYSFRDVVGLRTIAILRKRHHVPLQELRKVGQWLHERHDSPWATLRFVLKGKRVLFLDPKSGVATEPAGEGQRVLSIGLQPIAQQMRRAASKLRDRKPKEIGQITRNRYIVRNAWVVAGTRIPTSAVWNYYAAGFSIDQIIREYPRLKSQDIRAAIEFEASRQRVA